MLLLKSTHETILSLIERAHDAESDLQQNEIKRLADDLHGLTLLREREQLDHEADRARAEELLAKNSDQIHLLDQIIHKQSEDHEGYRARAEKFVDEQARLIHSQADTNKKLLDELLLLRRAGRITNVTEQSNYPLQDVEDTESTQATVEERVKLVRDAAAELERITSNFDASRVKPEIIAAQPKNSKEWEREHAPSSDAGDDIAVAVGTE